MKLLTFGKNRLTASIRVFSFIDCAVEDDSASHPNQLKFKGVLTMLDEPSTKPPNGSRGHRILIKSVTAKKLLHTLIDMGINYKDSLDAHSPQNKVGVIQKAWIKGSELWISGIIWRRDFPDAEKALSKNNLGMSFEAADIEVEDTKAEVWNLVDFHFTGATILYKNAAAYSKTSASLLASIAASAEKVHQIYGGAFMKTNKNKKGAGKTISAADGTLRQVKLLAAGQEALATSNKKGFRVLAQAVNKLAESQTELTKAILASVKSNDSEDDEEDEIEASGDDDGDDDEDEIDASGEDEDEMTAKGGKKSKTDDSDDDDDTDDADGDDVDAEGSDDEDGLEDMNDEGEIDEDEVPGTVNKGIVKNKGHKTTTTKMKQGKSKKVPIAASARVAEHMQRLQAQNDLLKKKLRRVNKNTAAKLEAAANATDRRSVANVGNDVKNIFKKGGINLEDVAAAGEKVSADEIDAAMDAAGIRDTQQRMALKTQLARNGLTD